MRTRDAKLRSTIRTHLIAGLAFGLMILIGAASHAVTPEPTCSDLWSPLNFVTYGKGQSANNNQKVTHSIFGNIVDPGSLGSTAHRIPVCAGTPVTIMVSDRTGIPTNTAGGSLSCDSAGCSGVVDDTEKYKSVSSDGKDTDRMTLLPK